MDDHSERVHGWNWSHHSDEKYCNANSYSMLSDADRGEPYVDSLRQLNRIVERILPESSSNVVVLSRQSSIKRPAPGDNLNITSSKRQHAGRSFDSSLCDSFSRQQSVTYRARSDVTRDTQKHDAHDIKPEGSNDVLNDSAYETIFGDGSLDNGEAGNNLANREFEDSCNQVFEPASKFSSALVEPVKLKDGTCAIPFRESVRRHRMFSIDLPDVKPNSKSKNSVAPEQISNRTVHTETWAKRRLTDDRSNQEEECSADDDIEKSKCQLSIEAKRHSSVDEQLDRITCNSDLSPSENRLNVSEDTAYEDECMTGSDSSVRTAAPSGSRSFSITTDETDRYSEIQEQNQPTSKEINRISEEDELKLFTCPHCAYSASKKGQVRKHMSVHGIFLCAHCEYSCERAESLEEHRRVHHPGLCGRRLCKKCRILFPSSELDLHERQCSGEKQRWACPECGKEFKFLSVMKAHAHKWHPRDGDGEFVPSVSSIAQHGSSEGCEKLNGKLDANEREHDAEHAAPIISKPLPLTLPPSTEKQYQCEECGKSFKTKWTLSNHAMQAHGANTPFCCDVDSCKGTPFRSDKELNCHRQAVHQLGPRKYECRHPGCTMQFAKYGHFKRHQSTHAGTISSTEGSGTVALTAELKFKCDWPSCSKAFIHQDYLQVHYRRHTDEKPYRCHHCDATYRQKSGLKYHLDKVHNEKTVGRCGRKRKFAVDADPAEVGRSVGTGIIVENGVDKANHELLRDTKHSAGSSQCCSTAVGNSIKQKLRDNVTAMQKSKEGLLVKIKLGQITPSIRCEKLPSDNNEKLAWSPIESGKDMKWSSKNVCQTEGREGSDLGNLGLKDDWMLGSNSDFETSDSVTFCKSKSTLQLDARDQDLIGSTSDTEPLDEDLCEELRKLSDVINGADLSPNDIESRPTTYDSSDVIDSFVESARLTDIISPDNNIHTVRNHRSELNQRAGSLSDGHLEQFPLSLAIQDIANMNHSLYARCKTEDVQSVKIESESSPSDVIACGRPVVFTTTFEGGQNAADIVHAGNYYDGVENNTPVDCFTDSIPHYSNSHNVLVTYPSSRSRNSTSIDVGSSRRHSEFDMANQAWPTSNSPYWPVRTADSMSSMSGHSSVSNPLAPVCTSAGPEFIDHMYRREDSYVGSERNWPSTENNDHHWPLNDGLGRDWCDSSHVQVDDQSAPNYRAEPNMHWHMGRQGESAFTPSRVGTNNTTSISLDMLGRIAASPLPGSQYHGTEVNFSTMPTRIEEAVDGYTSGTLNGSWSSNWYGRPGSTSSCGDGVYDHCISHDFIYKSPLVSEQFCLPTPSQPNAYASRSSLDYNRSIAMTHQSNGVYGYAIPQVQTTSPWSAGNLNDEIACRRSLPDVGGHHNRMPYQQNSMLYNMVPRYY